VSAGPEQVVRDFTDAVARHDFGRLGGEDGSPRMTITRLFRDGDRVVMEGRGEGRFRNGAPYDNRYVIVHEVVEGRLKTVREYMDTQHAASMFATAMAQEDG
jgi:ketosteroid isomerase-like protein